MVLHGSRLVHEVCDEILDKLLRHTHTRRMWQTPFLGT
jgi:hypothetical protein